MLPQNEVELFLATASTLQTRPMTSSRLRSSPRLRSPEISVQLSPMSSLRKSFWQA